MYLDTNVLSPTLNHHALVYRISWFWVHTHEFLTDQKPERARDRESNKSRGALQGQTTSSLEPERMLNLPVLQLTLQASQVRVWTSKRDWVHDLQARVPILGSMHTPSAFFHRLLNRQSYGCLCTTLMAANNSQNYKWHHNIMDYWSPSLKNKSPNNVIIIAEGEGRACNSLFCQWYVKAESFTCIVNNTSGQVVASVWVKAWVKVATKQASWRLIS